MNDKHMIERLLGEPPPPKADVTARARARLNTAIQASRPSLRTRLRRPVFGLAGLAAVATATALVVPSLATNGADPGLPRPPSKGDSSAREVLLVAADRAEQAEESPEGRYWRVRDYQMPVLDWLKVGEKGDKYNLTDAYLEEEWIGRDTDDGYWRGDRNIGHRPARKADWAAWKRDGSPRKWNLGPSDTPSQEDRIVTMKPRKPDIDRQGEGDRFLGYEMSISYEELQQLPDQPDALKQAILDLRDQAEYDPRLEDWLFDFTSELLASAPVSADVRAGAFRVLADLPNVRNLGPTEDPLGREGVALALKEEFDQDFVVRTEWIVDVDAGRVLSKKMEGPKSFYFTWLEAEWTNEKPAVPSKSDIPDIPYAG